MNIINQNEIEIEPSYDVFGGVIAAPPSKSMAHRLLIASALTREVVFVDNVVISEDIKATIYSLISLGVKISVVNEVLNDVYKIDEMDIREYLKNDSSYHRMRLKITGIYSSGERRQSKTKTELFCKESGSTLRFLIPISLLHKNDVVFSGSGRLVKRPLQPYFTIFDKMGIQYECALSSVSGCKDDILPLRLSGRLKAGSYQMAGDVSSQFISGLLMALPLCEDDSIVRLTSPLHSKPYVQMTINVLSTFGISIEHDDYKIFKIAGNQRYYTGEQMLDDISLHTYCNEGDYSQVAFWAVAAAIGRHPITITNIKKETLQADAVIFDILTKMGATIDWFQSYSRVTIYPIKNDTNSFKDIEISVKDCPDLVPILAVLGTARAKKMKIIDASRLRLKESDRLYAISRQLNNIGADIEELEDGLIIKGVVSKFSSGQEIGDRTFILNGGEVYSHGDHRIVMALAIAANLCKKPLIIHGANAIKKSYPNFFEDYICLNGSVKSIG